MSLVCYNKEYTSETHEFSLLRALIKSLVNTTLVVYLSWYTNVHVQMSETSKSGFRQVKIMKEFVWINIIFFLNLAFGQVAGNFF